MKKCIIILSLLLTMSAFAQEPHRLSVQDCIEMALENNIELKNS